MSLLQNLSHSYSGNYGNDIPHLEPSGAGNISQIYNSKSIKMSDSDSDSSTRNSQEDLRPKRSTQKKNSLESPRKKLAVKVST